MSTSLATKKVASVIAALAMVVGISFAFVAPAKADQVSDLQAQVQALLAQIQALQGSSTTTTTTGGSGACFTFTQNLKMGNSGTQVMWVQEFLNSHGFQVATTGAGSPGNETSYFGPATNAAVIKFQNAYATSILTPVGLTYGNGNWYSSTRAEANALCSQSTTTTTTGTGTTTTGTGVTISAATQPANSLAPVNANRVPFTTFTLTNTSGAPVTINSITVQRTGLANDGVFAGVELIDSNGLQIGTSRTFDSNHQAQIGTPFTLAAGTSMTYTVAANMQTCTSGTIGTTNCAATAYAGQVASVAVIAVNTSVPVAGTLPIAGAQQTINSSLTIGTATAYVSSYDPNSYRTQSIGTTGITFSGIRLTAGSAEDEKLYSITWNQTGSVGSNDLTNLMTYVNGTGYPVTVDSTGKYFTATFAGGLLIPKGNTVDAYLKGDITGNDAAGRTVEFDIYRSSDVYLVGQTYGYGITAIPNTTSAYASQTSSADTTRFTTSGSPFFEGSLTLINPGTLSTVSSAGSVGSQNIAINVPNQPLGGFTTNFTGEPVSVQQVVFHVASSTPGNQLTSVSLVDSNGNTVAGPVDENDTAATLTFNSSVTFPVGAMTYTLKGTVASTAMNGQTYQLSTNPSADWTNAQGQISGSNVSLPNSPITLSVMTIEGPSLVVSAASSPASSTVAPGAQNFVFANINLDASQSGEDIRLSSLPIEFIGSGSTANLSSCQLMNGSNPVNTGGNVINSSNWSGTGSGSTANFVLDNALTITKGTVVTLSLQCNLSSGATGTYALGVPSTPVPSPTGVGSGITLLTTGANTDLVIQTGTSGTFTVGNAMIAITAPTPTSYAQVAGGTTGVTVGTFTLQPTSDTINLQQVGLALNSNYASSSDVTRAYIYNSSGTPVGSVIFTGSPVAFNGGMYYLATSTLSAGASLAQNQQSIFTIKADVANIGTGQSGMSGHEVKISVADARGSGSSSGAQVDSGVSGITGNGVAIFRSYPVVAANSTYLSSNGVSDGRLLAFTVTANTANQVGIGKLSFIITPGASVTVTNPQLYAYTDSGFSNPAGGTNNGLVVSSGSTGSLDLASITSQTSTSTKMTTGLEIPAGTTEYFILKASSVTYGGANSTWNVTTSVTGDGTDLAPSMFTVSGLSGSNFVWSPNSTTTSLVSTNDWTNGFGVSGLPQFGISQTRSN